MTYTVGMEIESEYCIDVFVRDKLPPGWQIVHDASIKSSVRVNNIGEKSRMCSSQRSSDPFYTMGSEIISPVFSIEDFDLTKIRRDLCYITNLIQENGEPEKTWRSGIHIHVGIPEISLHRLKSIIQLGRYMEDIFFQISGQGYQFRGQFFNKCLYCRPITKKGPQVFYLNNDEDGERLIQLFNVHDLLSSEDISQFWDRYGGCTRDRQHWHPVRYSWLNLYSILYRGTLEFRPFNKTLNPQYILAEVELCMKFVDLINSMSYSEITSLFPEENSVFNMRDKSQKIASLARFSEAACLSDISRSTLETIIIRTPQVKLDNTYVLSHRSGKTSVDFRNYSPEEIHDVYESTQVLDIHNLEGR